MRVGWTTRRTRGTGPPFRGLVEGVTVTVLLLLLISLDHGSVASSGHSRSISSRRTSRSVDQSYNRYDHKDDDDDDDENDSSSSSTLPFLVEEDMFSFEEVMADEVEVERILSAIGRTDPNNNDRNRKSKTCQRKDTTRRRRKHKKLTRKQASLSESHQLEVTSRSVRGHKKRKRRLDPTNETTTISSKGLPKHVTAAASSSSSSKSRPKDDPKQSNPSLESAAAIKTKTTTMKRVFHRHFDSIQTLVSTTMDKQSSATESTETVPSTTNSTDLLSSTATELSSTLQSKQRTTIESSSDLNIHRHLPRSNKDMTNAGTAINIEETLSSSTAARPTPQLPNHMATIHDTRYSNAETRTNHNSGIRSNNSVRIPTATTTTTSTTTPWIRSFLQQRPKDRLLPVPKDYIADSFNLAQLPRFVEMIAYHALLPKDALAYTTALQLQRKQHQQQQEQQQLSSLSTTATTTISSTPIQTTSATTLAMSYYPIYRRALQMILREDDEEEEEEDATTTASITDTVSLSIPQYIVQLAAEALYLMIHSRFVSSPRGLEAIRHAMILDKTVFGECPRPLCNGCATLPYGYVAEYSSFPSSTTTMTTAAGSHGVAASTTAAATSSISSRTTLRTSQEMPDGRNNNNHNTNNIDVSNACHRFCPSCGEVWISWNSKTDGCAWGPSWCHLFLMVHGQQVYAEELDNIRKRRRQYNISAKQPIKGNSNMMDAHGKNIPTIYSSSPLFSTSSTATTGTITMESPPLPSVFGFQVHPATPFGRPFLEQQQSLLSTSSSSLLVSGGAAAAASSTTRSDDASEKSAPGPSQQSNNNDNIL